MIPFQTGINQVTATVTATSLFDLINTARVSALGSVANYSKLPTAIDHIEIDSEGTIRFTLDGSTPTTGVGLRVGATTGILVYEGVNLKDFIIVAGGNVAVNVQIGTEGKMP